MGFNSGFKGLTVSYSKPSNDRISI